MEGSGKQTRLITRILSRLRGETHRYYIDKSVSSNTFDLFTNSPGRDRDTSMYEDDSTSVPSTAETSAGEIGVKSSNIGEIGVMSSNIDLRPCLLGGAGASSGGNRFLRYGGQYLTPEQLPEFCDQLHNLVEVIRNIQSYAHITGEYPRSKNSIHENSQKREATCSELMSLKKNSELERRLETEAREVASLAAEVRNACDAITRTRAQRHAVGIQRSNLMAHLANVKETETRELENTVRLSDRKLFKHWETLKSSTDPTVFNSLLEEIRAKQAALECLVRLIEGRKANLSRNTAPPRPLPPPVQSDNSDDPSSGEQRERTETRRGTKRRYKEAQREARSVPLSGEPSRHEPVSHVTLYIEGTECASRQHVSSAGAVTVTPMDLPSHGSIRDIVFFTSN